MAVSGEIFQNCVQIGRQLLKINGLEQVVAHIEGAGFLGVFELGIAADDQNAGIRQKLAYLLQHLQPVHVGHSDVGDDDIRGIGAQEGKRVLGIGKRACDLKLRMLLLDIFSEGC